MNSHDVADQVQRQKKEQNEELAQRVVELLYPKLEALIRHLVDESRSH